MSQLEPTLLDADYVLTLDEIGSLAEESGKPAETLMNVVALIAKRFQTDVCSAYLLEPDRANLVLAATLGLRPQCIGTLRMPIHEGLSGLVAEEVRPVAVERVKNHPRFKYFREAGEDAYQSFLGVPLIDRGVLQGVLIVQTVDPRVFREDEIRMLMDAASQVAPVVSEDPGNQQEEFCMTVLALKLSRRANAVSALHGEVSRAMWTGLYPGRAEESVPIGHITNGVHVPTWLAPQMFRLYDRHLGSGWHEHGAEARIWERIEDVDDGELWETHLSLKARLLGFVRHRAVEQAERRGESQESRRRLARVLSPDALTVGFARRFATYKRANLILADIEMLAFMVNDPRRPVQFVFAGKAHPHDEPGKRVLQQIAELMRNPQFADKCVFVEDYDINVGRHFVQGVDVWLNNPRRPLASGTSGMKVVLNGGLNLSVLDGWWAEAYDGLNGFAIGTGITHSNMDVHDTRDGEDLYRYQRDRDGLPRGWIKRMKRTIRTLGWRFNADRMVMDYTLKCYVPAAAAHRAT